MFYKNKKIVIDVAARCFDAKYHLVIALTACMPKTLETYDMGLRKTNALVFRRALVNVPVAETIRGQVQHIFNSRMTPWTTISAP